MKLEVARYPAGRVVSDAAETADRIGPFLAACLGTRA